MYDPLSFNLDVILIFKFIFNNVVYYLCPQLVPLALEWLDTLITGADLYLITILFISVSRDPLLQSASSRSLIWEGSK